MKKSTLVCLILFAACSVQQNNTGEKTEAVASFSPDDKTVIVYTTADSTKDRMAVTDTLHFSSFGQPLETDACIFIDPTHTYQTMLGIGGALTDASAETFAKLPVDKQHEVLNAYYDDH